MRWNVAISIGDTPMPLIPTAGGLNLDEGIYDAVMLRCEDTFPATDSPYQTPQVRLYQAISGPDGLVEWSAWANRTLDGTKTKLRKWLTVLFGHELVNGQPCVYEDLKNVPCRVFVGRNQNGTMKVLDLLAPTKRGGAASPLPSPVVVEPDDIPF
jgi:hypothetical protein